MAIRSTCSLLFELLEKLNVDIESGLGLHTESFRLKHRHELISLERIASCCLFLPLPWSDYLRRLKQDKREFTIAVPMRPADQYHRFVRWSDEDQVYIGYCPDLYFGGVCHGEDEEQVYADLCGGIRDEIEHRQQRGEVLPVPAVRVTRDVEMAAH